MRRPPLSCACCAHSLAPTPACTRGMHARVQTFDGAKAIRQSVDVMRLSRIALSNLEKEGEGSDYTAAEARQGDIRIENADAELDFEEQKDEGTGVRGGRMCACLALFVNCRALLVAVQSQQ